MLERRFRRTAIALAAVAACSLPPTLALAAESDHSDALPPASFAISAESKSSVESEIIIPEPDPVEAYEAAQSLSAALPFSSFDIEQTSPLDALKERYEQRLAAEEDEARRVAELEKTDKLLAYDPALIAAVGNQVSSGHTICCPGYACAYGDAIVQGVAVDHADYGCGMCTWPRWGGGNSSFRSLGSNEALLREAYDQIAAGKPTVIHVTGTSNEHWITLIGYRGATNLDALSLDNFVALDPWDGTEIIAGASYSLYGDFCEHISQA